MTTTHRPRTLASLGALAAAALLLTGCGADEETAELRESLSSAEERLSSAEARIDTLQDEVDRIPNTEELRSQAGAAVSSAVGRAEEAVSSLGSGAENAAREAVDSLPDLPSAEQVEQTGREGRDMVVDLAEGALPQDPAELERRLEEAADRVRDSVPDLEDVEFRVGDRSFTF